MSDKIDQRIVEMSFENKKFEKGISQSTSSLKEFSNMLNKGFDKDFSSLEKSVDSVSYSLSMMEQIGIGALRRIGESAIDAGAKMIKSLSVDQLAAGWTKYEEKLDAVQTLISAGYDMSSVRKEMDQLMWFADETSYSFSDMANNMGKFVAAGVDLKTSSKAMQGIATWAAHSGKNTDSASIAMFNLSQAISMGYVDTLNWRSIMNQNMNTKMFKQVAIGVAEATGAVEKGAVTIQNFDSNLKTKWFSNDILLKTLDQYSSYAEKVREVQEEMEFGTANQAMEYMDTHADEYADVLNQIGNAAFKASQESKKLSDSIIATMDAVSSGWLRTYEIIFGELDEAKANFTALTEILWIVFASGAENRNEMLLWLKEAGGITNVFKGFKNVAIALLTLLKPISEAFDQIFPPKTKEQWLGMTKSFREFTDSLIISEKAADKVRRTFAGVFAVIDIGWQVLKFLGQAAFEVAKIFLLLGGTFLGTSASFGELLARIDYAIKSFGIFEYGLLAVKIGVTLLRETLAKVIGSISEFIHVLWNTESPFEYLMGVSKRIFSNLVEEIKMVVSWFSKLGKTVKSASGLFNDVIDVSEASVWSTMLDILKEIVLFIGNEAVDTFQNFGDVIKNLDFHKIATFVVGGVLLIFVKQLSDLTGAMTNFTNSVTGAVNGFTKKFLGPKTTTLVRDMAYAIGVLAASIWVLSRIPADDLNASLIGLAKAVGIFVVAYGLLQGINVATSKIMKDTEMVSSAFGLTAVAASLLIMATAVKTISKIDESKVWNSVGVLAAMFGFITAYQVLSALISQIPGQQKISMNLLGMSASILVLVGALTLLNLFSLNDIQESLVKMTGILLVIGGLQGIFALTARLGKNNKASVNILSMAVGIAALVVVLKLLSLIDSRTITESVGNLALIVLLIAGIEVVMGLASRISGGNKLKNNILATQFGMLAMIGLIKILNTMKQEDIDRGILNIAKMTGVIGAIELMTAISARIAGGAKVQKILGSVAITLLAFAGVIAILGIFDKSVIDQGIITLTKMVGLIVAIELLTAIASRISGGNGKMFTSLIGATLAILTLTGSLALLSMIDQESLRGAAISLSIASVAILALSLAMDKISGTVSLFSKGSQGFLDKVKSIGVTLVSLGALFVMTAAFFKGIELILPIIESVSLESFGKFIISIAAITTLLIVLNSIPMIDTGFMGRIKGLLPGFVAVTAILIGAIGFFGALKLILPIVDSISWDSLGKFTVGLGVVATLLSAMALLSPIFAAAGALNVTVLLGVVIAIASLSLVVLSVVGLAELLNWMIKDADALTRGLDLLIAVGAGISRFVGAMVGGLAGGVLEGIGHSLAAFVQSLSGFSSESLQGIKALAEAILIITGTSVLAGITSFVTGKSSMEVFGEQIAILVAAINEISPENASKASATLVIMKPMAENLKLFAEAAQNIPNSGGFVGDFLGENDIDVFGAKLSSFVMAFKNVTPEQAQHSTNVLTAMKPMAENLKVFAVAAKEIPNSGGFISNFMGNNDINVFGTMLAAFIKAFENITIKQAQHSTDVLAAMKPMATNLKKFAEAAQEIPSTGGFLKVFFGSIDLPTFSKQIHGLIETFGSIDKLQLSTATSSLQLMSETMLPALVKFSKFTNDLKASGGLAQFFSGNTTLSEFGSEFRKFIEILSDVDFSIVSPALEAMGKLTTSFETMGVNVIENAKKSFENNKQPFQKSIATILDEPIKKLEAQKQTLVKTVSSIFKAVTDKGDSYVKEFKTLGANLIEGLKSGIESKQSSAITSVKKVMSSVVLAARSVVDARSPSRVFETIGSWCTKGLANGISKETNVAVKAGTNMAKATEGGIRDTLGVHSISSIFSNIGGYIPTSIGEGIQNGKGGLLKTAKDLGVNTSNITLKGAVSTMAGGESSLTTGINSLLEILTDTTSPSAASTGIKLGGSLTGGFQNSLSNSSTGLGGSATQSVVKSELDKLKAIIEERSFYGQITVEEELEMYQQLRTSYKEGSEERKQIDREIYTRLKTIYEAQMSYIESVQNAQRDSAEERAKLEEDYIRNVTSAEADAAKDLADLKKKYNEDVLKARLDADKKREAQEKSYYNNLNSILENAEQERQRLREQYASNQKSINEKLLSDINAQNKAYEDAVKSRADAIYNSYSLFAAVDADVEVTGEELLKNLQDQGAALSEWKQSLAALAERGVGDALIEELQAMGPSTKAQIKALLTLTDEQLTEYVGLFEGKYTFARIKAEQELEGLKDSTVQAIQDLNAQAAINLDGLEIEFSNSMAEINANMANDMSELRETHNEALAEINRDLQEKLNDLETNWKTSSSKIKTDLDAKLKELETAYNDSMTKIDTDLKKNLDDMKTKFGTTMKEVSGLTEKELSKLVADNKTKLTLLNTDTEAKLNEIQKIYGSSSSKIVSSFGSTLQQIVPNTAATLNNMSSETYRSFESISTDFKIAGINAAFGFAKGIELGVYQVINAAEYLARAAINAAENILDEHSPSKVFEGIGKFVSMGFANGIVAYANRAEKASEDMVYGPIAAVSQALAEMEDSNDLSLTITPVLDLSNLRSTEIAQLLKTPIHLGSTSGKLASDTIQNGNRETTPVTSIVNKFDLTGLTVRTESDVDAIATKLYQKQQAASRGRGLRAPARA